MFMQPILNLVTFFLMERKHMREETQASSSKIMYNKKKKSNHGTQKEINSLHVVLMQKAHAPMRPPTFL